MTRDEFMKELAYLLQDVAEEDREDAMQYYRDYFDEAGPQKESDVIKEFGSPERVAAIIRSDIAGNLREGGEFTDSGYEDQRFKEPGYQMSPRLDFPDESESGAQGGKHAGAGDPWTKAPDTGASPDPAGPRTSKALKVILWIILIVVASPFLLGMGGGILGLAGGALGIIVGLLVALAAFTISMLIAGIALIPYGIFQMFAQPLDGLMVSGSGFLCLGAGLLALALCLLFYGRFVPFLIRGVIDSINRLIHKRR